MKVFVAGATGAIGRPLLRLLAARGHETVGLTRREERRKLIEALGASASVADALDPEALSRAVRESRATHAVHLLTALPPAGPLRARDLRQTDALRIRGTANLLRAASEAGIRRLAAESFVGVFGAASFASPVGEDEPLPPAPDRGPLAETVRALRSLEEQLRAARSEGRVETVVLRFGVFYGPEVPSTIELARRLQRRQVLLPRGAEGIASFVHVDDAAAAVLAAIENPSPGPVYHVADDEPTPLSEYLARAAAAFGAPPPRSAPLWLVRLAAPVIAAAATARVPLSNERAKRELGWRLRYPRLREGLPQVAAALSAPPPA